MSWQNLVFIECTVKCIIYRGNKNYIQSNDFPFQAEQYFLYIQCLSKKDMEKIMQQERERERET